MTDTDTPRRGNAVLGEDSPAPTRKKRTRRAGSSSTVNVSPETAEQIERLQDLFSRATGFDIDRIQVVARAVRALVEAQNWKDGKP